jgi:hypothetical protein
MKLMNCHKKPISMFVMVTFTILLCFWANQAPAAPSASAAENNSGTTMEKGDSNSPNFIEEESGSAPTVKKPHKFPWLLVGAAVVIGAAAIYFLVLKSTKYTLTVSLTGATGTPAATDKYKKGTAVAYNYTAQTGYINLEAKLDGVAVASSGTVTMDADHALTVTAVQGAAISVNSTPTGAMIYVNNTDSGFTTPHTFQYTTAVTKTVLVRLCGYGDHQQTVTANLGETVTVNPTMAEGIHEDFVVPASSCWKPATASYWTTSGGVYKLIRKLNNWDSNYYNHSFSGNYTLTAKMRRVKGGKGYSIGLLLATTTNAAAVTGYVFQYTSRGSWSIWVAKSVNLKTDHGGWNWIKSWKDSGAIKKGVGGDNWNTLKIVRSGSNYSFYINNVHLFSFTNATFNPQYDFLISAAGTEDVIVEYDYVYHSAGTTAGSIPGLPASPFTATDNNSNCQSDL